MPNRYTLKLGNSKYLKGIKNSHLNQWELGTGYIRTVLVWNLTKTHWMKPLWEKLFHIEGNKSIQLCMRQLYCKNSLIVKLWYIIAFTAEPVLLYVSLHGVVHIYVLSTPWSWPSGMGRFPASSVVQSNRKRAKLYDEFQKWKMCLTFSLFQPARRNETWLRLSCICVFRTIAVTAPAFLNHSIQDSGRRQVCLILKHIFWNSWIWGNANFFWQLYLYGSVMCWANL